MKVITSFKSKRLVFYSKLLFVKWRRSTCCCSQPSVQYISCDKTADKINRNCGLI